MPKTIGREAVIILAILIVAVLALAAYFTDRDGFIDEIGLFNPSYMDLHYGKITYPIHGYDNNMVVHPPLHYKLIAAFMRRGFTYYYAQATPAFLMLLVAIALILSAPFPPPVKMGFLFGLVAPLIITRTLQIELFGMRPENHINAAWIAGLVALESGRLENWNWRKLAAGSFLLAWASSLHYYAIGASIGAVVYAVWVLFQRGWKDARKPLLAIALPGLLFAAAYLLLFFIPQWPDIRGQLRSVPKESIAAVLGEHLRQYRDWAPHPLGGPWLKEPFTLGIPLVVLSTPILFALRSTRVLALAALPLQLFVLLFAGHKHAYYYLHEISIYATAVVAGLLTLIDLLLRKHQLLRRAALAMAALALGGALLAAKFSMRKTSILPFPRVQEAEIGRAAAKEMLGPNALVAGRLGIWYASGGANWFNIMPDLLWHPIAPDIDVPRYLARFDALAEHEHMSGSTSNDPKQTLSSWYVDGTLQLRGFFFAESNAELSHVLLSVRRPPAIDGFALKQHQLYRFEQNPTGTEELTSSVCPVTEELKDYRRNASFWCVIELPQPKSVVLTALQAPSFIRNTCRTILEVRGNLVPVDTDALVDKLRREDKPMHFYRSQTDLPAK